MRSRSATRGTALTAIGVGTLLTLALGTAAAPASASAARQAVQPNEAGGPILGVGLDLGALYVSTTTDTLPGEQAAHYQIIAGDPVRRVYVLRNDGLLTLKNVIVHDPDVSSGAMQCGPAGGPSVAALPPHSSASCSATFTAVPGEHDTTVTASGTVFLLNIIRLSGKSKADYTAVVPALQASLSLGGGPSGASLPAGTAVSATVTVRNAGSVQLTQIAPTDPQPLTDFSCGDDGATVARLAAGESAACSGALTPEPGPHVSSLTIVGNWLWKWPLTAQGPQPRRTLKVRTVANAAYTGLPVSSPTPRPTPVASPPSTAPAPTTPPSEQPAPVIVVPSRSPHSTPTPAAAPSSAVLQTVSQFQASRGLPLPLKVLVVIVIPAVAAAAGARRIAAGR